MEKWSKVNPGGETKEAFDKGEIVGDDGVALTAAALQQKFEAMRNSKNAQNKAETVAKSIEEIQFIGLMQMAIAKEREELGLPAGYHIPLERVRFFHPEVWNSDNKERGGARSSESTAGEYDPSWDLVDTRLGTDARRPFQHFSILDHELLHQASHFETDPVGKRLTHKSGFHTADKQGFGLNEAVTETLNQELLKKHEQALLKYFPNTESSYDAWFGIQSGTYSLYRDVLSSVIKQVDMKLHAGKAKTWQDLKRGYLEGDSMALQSLEEVLGKQAFRLFMAMGSEEKFDVEQYQKKYNFPTAKGAFHALEIQIERYFTNNLKLSEERLQKLLDDVSVYIKDVEKETIAPINGNSK
ncbi:MAG: hypothetical protein JWM46_98 [Candidatus Kaiserbacteria bacterium]|nr:hypothetical protein [Candidatus Kaiserbacteria bacterium]